MDRELLNRPVPQAGETESLAPPLHLLDHELDREFARACALVGRSSDRGVRVTLAAEAGGYPVPLFWAACNARAAQLCNQYGVEVLLVEEDGRVRLRIEPHAAPRSDDVAGDGDAGAAPRRWPRLRRWLGLAES